MENITVFIHNAESKKKKKQIRRIMDVTAYWYTTEYSR